MLFSFLVGGTYFHLSCCRLVVCKGQPCHAEVRTVSITIVGLKRVGTDGVSGNLPRLKDINVVHRMGQAEYKTHQEREEHLSGLSKYT